MTGWPSGYGCTLDRYMKSNLWAISAWVGIPLLATSSDVIKFGRYLIGMVLLVYEVSSKLVAFTITN